MQRKIGLLPDIVDKETRSRMMSGIRGKNTKPELVIRKGLHARGFRFRLHSSKVPGKPDLVLPRYRAAIFVHGCFWHSHDCHFFKMPSTRPDFWKAKLARNRERDEEVRKSLLDAGWRILVIWECAIKGKNRIDLDELFTKITAWIRGEDIEDEIAGRPV
jgi:DNA mismatch endonuclease (patch repair protein)